MKRLALVIALLIAAAAGIWWLIRRHPGAPEEAARSTAFSVQQLGSGWLIQHLDEQIPLRAFRWVPTRGEAILVAQVLTQNDEQQVHLFRAGKLEGSWKVERPPSTPEAFFRFAELNEVIALPRSALLLMYTSGSGHEESLLAFLDLKSGSLRWSLRLAGSRLALAGDPKDPAIFVWGSEKVVQRVALGLADKAPIPTNIDLPPETSQPADLLPAGTTGFFLAHAKGLSIFGSSKGWIHHPLPVQPSFPVFPGKPGRLARMDSIVCWQPFPGLLYELGPGGNPFRAVTLDLNATEIPSYDSRLLNLLGCDPQGNLWFGLAKPVVENPAEPAAPESTLPTPEQQAGQPTDPPPEPQDGSPSQSAEIIEGWRQHLGRGLGRIYRRPKAGGPMRCFDWSSLWNSWPGGSGGLEAQPTGGFRPESGFIVLEGARRAWWRPLETLGATESLKKN
jgi:hypothetical protein